MLLDVNVQTTNQDWPRWNRKIYRLVRVALFYLPISNAITSNYTHTWWRCWHFIIIFILPFHGGVCFLFHLLFLHAKFTYSIPLNTVISSPFLIFYAEVKTGSFYSRVFGRCFSLSLFSRGRGELYRKHKVVHFTPVSMCVRGCLFCCYFRRHLVINTQFFCVCFLHARYLAFIPFE